ncbi:MAG: rhomboid family intramembrane serine protease [Myxococcota bacterium]
MPTFDGRGFNVRAAPLATKWLAIALLITSLVASVTQRSYGIGVSDLQFRIDAVLAWELWRLLTYPLVESTPFGLIISLLVLWLFGGWLERAWGRTDFLRFFVVSGAGAALLAMPFAFLINWLLPFRDAGVAEGPGPIFDAMLVAIAVTAPNSTVLFGFALPVRARTVVLLLLAFHVITGIQTGASTLGITLGGMVMGYLLATGNWRPGRWLERLRARRRSQVRHGLYVVPPRERDRTLH